MKTKTTLVVGLAVVAYSVEVTREAVLIQRSNRKLRSLVTEALEVLETRTELVNLYARILNDNRVPMTDFDQIIMNELTQ